MRAAEPQCLLCNYSTPFPNPARFTRRQKRDTPRTEEDVTEEMAEARRMATADCSFGDFGGADGLGTILRARREPPVAVSERGYTAEIIRSEFGVPHIYGKTDADVAYGVAIAHAEDDFFTLQDVIAMARGRYGAIAGEEGAQVDYVYHLLDARGTAERHYSGLPADTRALFEAYATGLNQYAEENASELKLGNLFPVNGEDVATGFVLRQPFFFGLNNVMVH